MCLKSFWRFLGGVRILGLLWGVYGFMRLDKGFSKVLVRF